MPREHRWPDRSFDILLGKFNWGLEIFEAVVLARLNPRL
jgi:hypothetical protein